MVVAFKCLSFQKNGVRGIKASQNMTIRKLMTNKHENICNGVYWNDSVPGWKLSGWSHDAEWMVEGGERNPSEKGSDIQLLGLPLHVIIHHLARCHDRIHHHLPPIWKMPFPSFWGRGHNLHSKFLHLMKHWTWWFPWFCLHFSWWNKSLVSHNGIRLTAMLIPYPTHPNLMIPLILSSFFLMKQITCFP